MGVTPFDLTSEEVAKMIRIKARLYAGRPPDRAWDHEDYEQDAKAHLLENALKLKARRASQMTVIDRAVRNRILNTCESQRARKRDRRRDVDIDHAPQGALLHGQEGLDQLIDQIDVAEAIASLPNDELREVALRLRESEREDIMGDLKLTRGQLRQRMEEIGRHFFNFGLRPNSQSQPDSGQ